MLLRSFKSALHRRPLLTQMAVSGVISASGDCLSQFVIERRKLSEYDPLRTGRFFLLTSCFIAPCLNRWFHVLERVRGHPKIVPLKRVFLDQACAAPPWIAIILFNLRVLEGIPPQKSIEMMKRDWWPVYSTSVKVFTCVQLVNFYLFPLNMRVIVMQVAALFWNSFLSYKTQRKVTHD